MGGSNTQLTMTAPSVSNRFPIDQTNIGPRININFDNLTNYLSQRNNGTAAWDNFVTKSPLIDVRAFGAKGDGSTDDTGTIQDALDHAGTLTTKGTVYLPKGNYLISSVLDIPVEVNLVGDGARNSRITADDCNAVQLNFTTGFGNVILRDFGIEGANGTTRTAIIAPGTLDDADELYGVTIYGILIRDFNIALSFRTVRNFHIQNCWFQDIDQALNLTGKNLLGHIIANKFVRASGNGAGDEIGILLNTFNYTGGSGVIRPEGIRLISNYIYGFEDCIRVTDALAVDIIANDIDATVHGIRFTTALTGFNIKDNIINCTGANVVAGIIGHGLGSAVDTLVNIEGNAIAASGTSSADGIRINDSGNQNQNHINIVRNFIDGFTGTDIRLNNPGVINVENNRCESSSPTNSIIVGTIIKAPVYVQNNFCAGLISYTASDETGQKLILGHNIISGTTTKEGHRTHTHADNTEGGQLDWDDVWADAVHTHQSNAEGGTLDHGAALTGLTDDDHAQYGLLAGRSGGQTLQGGTAAGNDLTLQSTSHATKGSVLFGTGTTQYDEVNDDFYTEDYTDYFSSSTVVGWSSFTEQFLRYKKIGKLVWVSFRITGTSDATSVSFTLPFTSANTFATQVAINGADNGTSLTAFAIASLPANSATVSCFVTPDGGAWTNANTKRVTGQFFYQAA